jgi:site-specific DNA-methyltransferase (adenine-specific)
MLNINQIYLGDCLEVMKDIDDKSIDMILCDLPYGITACKWDTIIPFERLWEQYKRINKDNGAIVLFGSQPFTSKLIMSNLKMFKYEWIWEKTQASNFMNIKYQPLKSHENILIFGNNGFCYNPIRIKRTEKSLLRHKKGTEFKEKIKTNHKMNHLNFKITNQTYDKDGMKNPISVIKFSNNKAYIGLEKTYNSKFKHPTQKPVALFEYLIKTYTNESELVLDNCIGSGTTAISCLNTNRKFIGIELNQEYCEIANKRIEHQKQQMDLFKVAI